MSNYICLSLIILIATLSGCVRSTGFYDLPQNGEPPLRIEYDLEQCEMIGWKENFKVDASIDILQQYKGKAGFDFTRNRTRELDDLQKDLGIKFQANCKTYLMTGRTDEELYKCEVSKLGDSLNELRKLNEILSTVKSEADAQIKRDVVLATLEYLDTVKGRDCTKGVRLNKEALHLTYDTSYEDSFSVINNSSVRIHWNCFNFPVGFRFIGKCKGDLAPKQSSAVVLITPKMIIGMNHMTKKNHQMWIHASNEEQIKVTLITDTKWIPRNLNATLAIELARNAVSDNFISKKKYPLDLLAAGILFDNSYYEESKSLLVKLAESNPSSKNSPEYLISSALVHYKTGDAGRGYELARSAISFSGWENALDLLADILGKNRIEM